MTEQERERVLQYFFRKYDGLGPKSLSEARRQLCQKMIQTTDITAEAFDELIDDLINENNWTESRAMAYFECVSIEDRI
tara:strand:+ start:286 stop:522 length:237 start_codon:yes stop_codon:yes gene_type:complete